MRKFQYAKLLELMQTLREAGRQLYKQSSSETLCALLADIQDFAIKIGQYIEAIAGNETQTVALLEDFCELLYQSCEEKSVVHTGKKLEKQIAKIYNSICSELRPDKIEAAFFPYKASMADSLETIWEAALEDPACIVTICPIPYFDRLPDGRLGKMHYEGDAYPKNLPLVHWQEYNLEACRPDIIFIHAPYDQMNYITSIHPDFYSKRLRAYTDMLVYVPYFITISDVPEDFCTTAGCIYANKIIVQSERVCQTYTRVFKSAFNNRFGKPEEKFIPMGSPKLDKIISAKRTDWELPEKWKEQIAGKKVVLFNTSIGGLLKDSQQYLIKLQDVLSLFQGYDAAVLWWRPHPLSESTFRCMRPSLASEYRRIVEEYLQGAYGIYDDTPDLHRAIAWSDAYYGDNASSVLALWLATGKPMLVQDINCLSNSIENVGEIIPETAFTAAGTWEERMESSAYPQINLNNFLKTLTADKLPPLPLEEDSYHFILPEEGAGKAIYQYIKKQVMPT